jgi:hypothetical protein
VGSNTVKSGPPTKSPAKGEDLNWPYSITLMDSKGEVDTIDPMVIIKNDP